MTSITQLPRGYVAAPGLLGPPRGHCPPATAPQSPPAQGLRVVSCRNPCRLRSCLQRKNELTLTIPVFFCFSNTVRGLVCWRDRSWECS